MPNWDKFLEAVEKLRFPEGSVKHYFDTIFQTIKDNTQRPHIDLTQPTNDTASIIEELFNPKINIAFDQQFFKQFVEPIPSLQELAYILEHAPPLIKKHSAQLFNNKIDQLIAQGTSIETYLQDQTIPELSTLIKTCLTPQSEKADSNAHIKRLLYPALFSLIEKIMAETSLTNVNQKLKELNKLIPESASDLLDDFENYTQQGQNIFQLLQQLDNAPAAELSQLYNKLHVGYSSRRDYVEQLKSNVINDFFFLRNQSELSQYDEAKTNETLKRLEFEAKLNDAKFSLPTHTLSRQNIQKILGSNPNEQDSDNQNTICQKVSQTFEHIKTELTKNKNFLKTVDKKVLTLPNLMEFMHRPYVTQHPNGPYNITLFLVDPNYVQDHLSFCKNNSQSMLSPALSNTMLQHTKLNSYYAITISGHNYEEIVKGYTSKFEEFYKSNIQDHTSRRESSVLYTSVIKHLSEMGIESSVALSTNVTDQNNTNFREYIKAEFDRSFKQLFPDTPKKIKEITTNPEQQILLHQLVELAEIKPILDKLSYSLTQEKLNELKDVLNSLKNLNSINATQLVAKKDHPSIISEALRSANLDLLNEEEKRKIQLIIDKSQRISESNRLRTEKIDEINDCFSKMEHPNLIPELGPQEPYVELAKLISYEQNNAAPGKLNTQKNNLNSYVDSTKTIQRILRRTACGERLLSPDHLELIDSIENNIKSQLSSTHEYLNCHYKIQRNAKSVNVFKAGNPNPIKINLGRSIHLPFAMSKLEGVNGLSMSMGGSKGNIAPLANIDTLRYDQSSEKKEKNRYFTNCFAQYGQYSIVKYFTDLRSGKFHVSKQVNTQSSGDIKKSPFAESAITDPLLSPYTQKYEHSYALESWLNQELQKQSGATRPLSTSVETKSVPVIPTPTPTPPSTPTSSPPQVIVASKITPRGSSGGGSTTTSKTTPIRGSSSVGSPQNMAPEPITRLYEDSSFNVVKMIQNLAPGKPLKTYNDKQHEGYTPHSPEFHNPVLRLDTNPKTFLNETIRMGRLGETIIKAAQELKVKGFTHNDIKPENLLFKDDKVTFIDFNTAGFRSDSDLQEGTEKNKTTAAQILGCTEAELTQDSSKFTHADGRFVEFQADNNHYTYGRNPVLDILNPNGKNQGTLSYLYDVTTFLPEHQDKLTRLGASDDTLDNWALMTMIFGVCNKENYFKLSEGRKLAPYLISEVIKTEQTPQGTLKLAADVKFDEFFGVPTQDALMYIPSTTNEGEPLHLYRRLLAVQENLLRESNPLQSSPPVEALKRLINENSTLQDIIKLNFSNPQEMLSLLHNATNQEGEKIIISSAEDQILLKAALCYQIGTIIQTVNDATAGLSHNAGSSPPHPTPLDKVILLDITHQSLQIFEQYAQINNPEFSRQLEKSAIFDMVASSFSAPSNVRQNLDIKDLEIICLYPQNKQQVTGAQNILTSAVITNMFSNNVFDDLLPQILLHHQPDIFQHIITNCPEANKDKLQSLIKDKCLFNLCLEQQVDVTPMIALFENDRTLLLECITQYPENTHVHTAYNALELAVVNNNTAVLESIFPKNTADLSSSINNQELTNPLNMAAERHHIDAFEILYSQLQDTSRYNIPYQALFETPSSIRLFEERGCLQGQLPTEDLYNIALHAAEHHNFEGLNFLIANSVDKNWLKTQTHDSKGILYHVLSADNPTQAFNGLMAAFGGNKDAFQAFMMIEMAKNPPNHAFHALNDKHFNDTCRAIFDVISTDCYENFISNFCAYAKGSYQATGEHFIAHIQSQECDLNLETKQKLLTYLGTLQGLETKCTLAIQTLTPTTFDEEQREQIFSEQAHLREKIALIHLLETAKDELVQRISGIVDNHQTLENNLKKAFKENLANAVVVEKLKELSAYLQRTSDNEQVQSIIESIQAALAICQSSDTQSPVIPNIVDAITGAIQQIQKSHQKEIKQKAVENLKQSERFAQELQKINDKLNEQNLEYQNRRVELQKTNTLLEDANKQLRSELQEKSNAHTDLTSEIEAARNTNSELTEKINATKRQLAELESTSKDQSGKQVAKIEELTNQVGELEESLKNNNALIAEKENQFLEQQRAIEELNKQLSQIADQKQNVDREIGKLRKENESLTKELNGNKNTIERLQAEMVKLQETNLTLERRQNEIEKQSKSVHEENERVSEKIITLEKINEELTNQISLNKETHTELNSQIESATKENRALTTQRDNLQRQLEEKTALIAQVQEQIKELTETAENISIDKDSVLNPLKAKLDELKASVDATKNELAQKQEELKSSNSRITELEENIAEIRKENEALNSRLVNQEALLKELDATKEKLSEQEKELKQLRIENSELLLKVDTQQETLNKQADELVQIRDENSVLSEQLKTNELEINSLKGQLTTLRENVNSEHANRVKELEARITTLSKENEGIQDELSRNSEAGAILKNELEALKLANTQLTDQVTQLTGVNSELNKALASNKIKITYLRKHINDTKVKLLESEKECTELKGKDNLLSEAQEANALLRQQLAENTSKLEQLQSKPSANPNEITALQEKIDFLNTENAELKKTNATLLVLEEIELESRNFFKQFDYDARIETQQKTIAEQNKTIESLQRKHSHLSNEHERLKLRNQYLERDSNNTAKQITELSQLIPDSQSGDSIEQLRRNFITYVDTLKKEKDKLEQESQELHAIVDSITDEYDDTVTIYFNQELYPPPTLIEKLEKLSKLFEQSQTELRENLAQSTREQSLIVHKQKSEITSLQEQNALFSTKIKDLLTLLEQSNSTIVQEVAAELVDIDINTSSSQDDLQILNQRIQSLLERCIAAEKENMEIQKSVEETRVEIFDANSSNKQLKIKVTSLEKESSEVKAQSNRLEQENEEFKESIKSLNEQLQMSAEENRGLVQRIDNTNNDHRAEIEKLVAKYAEEIRKHDSTHESDANSIIVLQNQYLACLTEIDNKYETISIEQSTELYRKQQENELLQKQLNQLQGELLTFKSSSAKELDNAKILISALNNENDDQYKQLSAKITEISQLRGTVNELYARNNVLKSWHLKLIDINSKLDHALSQAHNESIQATTTITHLNENIKDLKRERAHIIEKIRALETNNSEISDANRSLKELCTKQTETIQRQLGEIQYDDIQIKENILSLETQLHSSKQTRNEEYLRYQSKLKQLSHQGLILAIESGKTDEINKVLPAYIQSISHQILTIKQNIASIQPQEKTPLPQQLKQHLSALGHLYKEISRIQKDLKEIGQSLSNSRLNHQSQQLEGLLAQLAEKKKELDPHIEQFNIAVKDEITRQMSPSPNTSCDSPQSSSSSSSTIINSCSYSSITSSENIGLLNLLSSMTNHSQDNQQIISSAIRQIAGTMQDSDISDIDTFETDLNELKDLAGNYNLFEAGDDYSISTTDSFGSISTDSLSPDSLDTIFQALEKKILLAKIDAGEINADNITLQQLCDLDTDQTELFIAALTSENSLILTELTDNPDYIEPFIITAQKLGVQDETLEEIAKNLILQIDDHEQGEFDKNLFAAELFLINCAEHDIDIPVEIYKSYFDKLITNSMLIDPKITQLYLNNLSEEDLNNPNFSRHLLEIIVNTDQPTDAFDSRIKPNDHSMQLLLGLDNQTIINALPYLNLTHTQISDELIIQLKQQLLEYCIANPQNIPAYINKLWSQLPNASLVSNRPNQNDVDQYFIDAMSQKFLQHALNNYKKFITALETQFSLYETQFFPEDAIPLPDLAKYDPLLVSQIQEAMHDYIIHILNESPDDEDVAFLLSNHDKLERQYGMPPLSDEEKAILNSKWIARDDADSNATVNSSSSQITISSGLQNNGSPSPSIAPSDHFVVSGQVEPTSRDESLRNKVANITKNYPPETIYALQDPPSIPRIEYDKYAVETEIKDPDKLRQLHGEGLPVYAPTSKIEYHLKRAGDKISTEIKDISAHGEEALALTIMNMIDNVLAKGPTVNIDTDNVFAAKIADLYVNFLRDKVGLQINYTPAAVLKSTPESTNATSVFSSAITKMALETALTDSYLSVPWLTAAQKFSPPSSAPSLSRSS